MLGRNKEVSMKNDLKIEVEGYVEDKIGTLCFSYVDKEDNVVGYFDVNRNGKMHFFVGDSDYKSRILPDLSKISGREINDDIDELDYFLKEDKDRWNRTKEFIERKNLEIKYREDKDIEYEEEEKDLEIKYYKDNSMNDDDEEEYHKSR